MVKCFLFSAVSDKERNWSNCKNSQSSKICNTVTENINDVSVVEQNHLDSFSSLHKTEALCESIVVQKFC